VYLLFALFTGGLLLRVATLHGSRCELPRSLGVVLAIALWS
jgi:hypothetical protein